MERARKADQKTYKYHYHSWYPSGDTAFQSLLKMLNQRFSKTLKRHISRGIPALLTIFRFFGPVFYGLSDGGIHFSIQCISFFGIFSFLVKSLEQKKTSASYEILYHFRRLHPPCQKSPYTYLTVCGSKSFLAAGLP